MRLASTLVFMGSLLAVACSDPPGEVCAVADDCAAGELCVNGDCTSP